MLSFSTPRTLSRHAYPRFCSQERLVLRAQALVPISATARALLKDSDSHLDSRRTAKTPGDLPLLIATVCCWFLLFNVVRNLASFPFHCKSLVLNAFTIYMPCAKFVASFHDFGNASNLFRVRSFCSILSCACSSCVCMSSRKPLFCSLRICEFACSESFLICSIFAGRASSAGVRAGARRCAVRARSLGSRRAQSR